MIRPGTQAGDPNRLINTVTEQQRVETVNMTAAENGFFTAAKWAAIGVGSFLVLDALFGGSDSRTVGGLPSKCSQSRFKRARACAKPWRQKRFTNTGW